jgi:iron complex transport system ATP-binding protein
VRVALGLARPDAGRALVFGRDVATLAPRELARAVAATLQEEPVDFPFTVAETVLLGRTPHLGPLGLEGPADLAAADRALAAVGAQDLAGRPIHALSGGELRRVLLARALAQEADALVLDEPTAAVDLHHQLALFERLRAEADRGRAVLVVVHDLNLAAAYCDRLLVLAAGEVVGEGPPAEVLTEALVERVFRVRAYVTRNERTGTPLVIACGSR